MWVWGNEGMKIMWYGGEWRYEIMWVWGNGSMKIMWYGGMEV